MSIFVDVVGEVPSPPECSVAQHGTVHFSEQPLMTDSFFATTADVPSSTSLIMETSTGFYPPPAHGTPPPNAHNVSLVFCLENQ